mgnify:CR=1 FL=1
MKAVAAGLLSAVAGLPLVLSTAQAWLRCTHDTPSVPSPTSLSRVDVRNVLESFARSYSRRNPNIRKTARLLSAVAGLPLVDPALAWLRCTNDTASFASHTSISPTDVRKVLESFGRPYSRRNPNIRKT